MPLVLRLPKDQDDRIDFIKLHSKAVLSVVLFLKLEYC
jgi:hypothetical protein